MLEKFGKFIFCIVLVWTGLLAGIEINKFEYWLMWSLVVFGFLVGIGVGHWFGLNSTSDSEYINELEIENAAFRKVIETQNEIQERHQSLLVQNYGNRSELAMYGLRDGQPENTEVKFARWHFPDGDLNVQVLCLNVFTWLEGLEDEYDKLLRMVCEAADGTENQEYWLDKLEVWERRLPDSEDDE